jgi:hypothetical protein
MRVQPDILEAAKRASDTVNQLLTDHGYHTIKDCYLAVRLSDGGSDGVLYATKRDAVRHQLDERQCAYVCFRSLAFGSSASEMAVFLQFNRNAYDAGLRLTDPDDIHGGRVPIPTARAVDAVREDVFWSAVRAAERRMQQ